MHLDFATDVPEGSGAGSHRASSVSMGREEAFLSLQVWARLTSRRPATGKREKITKFSTCLCMGALHPGSQRPPCRENGYTRPPERGRRSCARSLWREHMFSDFISFPAVQIGRRSFLILTLTQGQVPNLTSSR